MTTQSAIGFEPNAVRLRARTIAFAIVAFATPVLAVTWLGSSAETANRSGGLVAPCERTAAAASDRLVAEGLARDSRAARSAKQAAFQACVDASIANAQAAGQR
jgi:hypothetical protein